MLGIGAEAADGCNDTVSNMRLRNYIKDAMWWNVLI